MNVFPPELVELVLHCIADGDTLSFNNIRRILNACALVSRSWGTLSQQLIFREVHIYPLFANRHAYHISRFTTLLKKSPHIIPLVKCFGITLPGVTVSQRDLEQFNKELEWVLTCLVKLKHVIFKCERILGRRHDHSIIFAPIRRSLSSLPDLQSVVWRRTRSNENIGPIFRACEGSRVRTIVLDELDVAFELKLEHDCKPPSIPELEEIRLRDCGRADWLDSYLVHPTKAFPKLHTICITTTSAAYMCSLNEKLSLSLLKGLHCLHVIWDDINPDFEPQPDPGPNSVLEQDMPLLAIGTFSKVVLEYRIDYHNDIAILWWCRVFGSLKSSIIRSVTLTVYIQGANTTSIQPWHKLDQILGRPHFSSMEQFVLNVMILPWKETTSTDLAPLTAISFPETSLQADVTVNYTVSKVPDFRPEYLKAGARAPSML